MNWRLQSPCWHHPEHGTREEAERPFRIRPRVRDDAPARTGAQRALRCAREETLSRMAACPDGVERSASRDRILAGMMGSGRLHRASAEDQAALSYARAWVRRSQEPAAWSNLAAVYATKRPPDLVLARRWYRRAALKAHDRAMFEYGLMLIRGEGGAKSPAHGRRFLERAAALGQLDALKVLSYALTEGGYSYEPSPMRAKRMKAALRRALARSRKGSAG